MESISGGQFNYYRITNPAAKYLVTFLSNNSSFGIVENQTGNIRGGDVVTVNAIVNSNYEFDHWEDENGNNLGNENPLYYLVRKNDEQVVKAVFLEKSSYISDPQEYFTYSGNSLVELSEEGISYYSKFGTGKATANIPQYYINNGEKIYLERVTPATNSVFYKSFQSIGIVNIPEGYKYLDFMAFFSLFQLKEINFPESLLSIGDRAVSYSYQGTFDIRIPKNVSYISDGAFLFSHAIQHISVDPENTIYDSRNNCNGIIETATNRLITANHLTVIPDSVTTIGTACFVLDTSGRTIEIPSNIQTIEASAIHSAYSRNAILKMDSPTPPSLMGILTFAGASISKIRVPRGSLSAYTAATNWAQYSNIMEEY